MSIEKPNNTKLENYYVIKIIAKFTKCTHIPKKNYKNSRKSRRKFAVLPKRTILLKFVDKPTLTKLLMEIRQKLSI